MFECTVPLRLETAICHALVILRSDYVVGFTVALHGVFWLPEGLRRWRGRANIHLFQHDVVGQRFMLLCMGLLNLEWFLLVSVLAFLFSDAFSSSGGMLGLI